MPDIGYASMPVIPTFKGLQGQLERGSSKGLAAAGASGGTKFGDAAGTSAGRRFGDKFKTAAKAGVIAGLAGLAAGGKLLADSIGAASDLNETVSKTAQIFGQKATPALVGFAEQADKTMGQSKQQALDAAASFGVFGKSAGLQGGKLVKFSTRLSTLASDMASFSNTSPDQAIEAIGAALRGEAEPIRAYGVLLDDATLKAEAMRLGILKPVKDKGKILSAQARVIDSQAKYNEAVKKYGKDSLEAYKANGTLVTAQTSLGKATQGTIPALTQQQKVLAAQSSIYRQTKDQQGDFSRTSSGLANQQRILAARFDNAKSSLGKGLLPVATDLVTFLNNKGVPALEKFSTWFTEKGVPAIGKFTRKATPFVKGVLTDTRDILKDIEPYAKGVAEAFNSLPSGVKKGLGAAALLGFAGSKLPGVKTGAGAGAGVAKTLLGQFTKSGVQKVYVVNEGFGTPGKPKPKSPGGVLPPILAFPLPGPAGINAEVLDPRKPKGPIKVPFTDTKIGTPQRGLGKPIPDAKLTLDQLKAEYADVLKNGTGKGLEADKARLQQIQAAMDAVKVKTTGAKDEAGKFSTAFDRGIVKAQHLNNEVKLIGSNARGSRAEVQKLLAALDKARSDSIKLNQGVSAARVGKVDAQLGRGVTVIHNGNIVANSPRDYHTDAQRRSRRAATDGIRNRTP